MSYQSFSAAEFEARRRQQQLLVEAEHQRLVRQARAGKPGLPVVVTLHVAGALHGIADWLESTAPSASSPHPQ